MAIKKPDRGFNLCVCVWPSPSKLLLNRSQQGESREGAGRNLCGHKDVHNAARANLKRGIEEAKFAYKMKTEEYFNENRLEGGKEYHVLLKFREKNQTEVNFSTTLIEELNKHFRHFEIT